MALGNNVRVFRLARRESLRDVADAAGMDRAHVHRLEREQAGCSDEKKLALARHFGVSVTRLFFQEDDPVYTPAPQEVRA